MDHIFSDQGLCRNLGVERTFMSSCGRREIRGFYIKCYIYARP
jgi:hypothetical protein